LIAISSSKKAATHNAALPTHICKPTTVIKFPPDDAPRTVKVATASASAPITHKPTPNKSTSPATRAPIISPTPASPATNPATPKAGTFSRNTTQPINATSSGIEDAIIAANDACTVCMATKFSPR